MTQNENDLERRATWRVKMAMLDSVPGKEKMAEWKASRAAARAEKEPAKEAQVREQEEEPVGAKECRIPTAADRLQAFRDAGNAPARNPFEKPKDHGRDR